MANRVLDDVRRVYQRTWWALLLRGLLSLTVGIFIFARPLDSIGVFALVIAFWALFSGLVHVAQAIELRPIVQHWWVLLLSGLVGVGFGIAALFYYPGLSLTFGILSVVAGVIAIMIPPVTLATIMALIAGFALVSGVVLLIGAFKLSSARAAVTDAITGAKGS